MEDPTCATFARERVGFDLGLFRLRFGFCRIVTRIVYSHDCQEERTITNGDSNAFTTRKRVGVAIPMVGQPKVGKLGDRESASSFQSRPRKQTESSQSQ